MKEDFDDILRKKWEERQFPVDQSHRADMIRLLDQNNRRRTGFLWWFFGVGVASAIIALVVILNDAERLDRVISPMENASSIEFEEAKANEMENSKSRAEDETPSTANEVQDVNVQADGKYATEIHSSAGELQHSEKVEGKEKAGDESKAKAEIMLRPASTQPHAKTQQPANNSDGKSKPTNNKKEQTIAETDVIDKPGDDKNELNTNLSNPSDHAIIANSTENKETVVPAITPNEVESTNIPVGNTNENIPLVVRNDFVTDPIDALAFGNIDFSSNNEIGNVEPVIVQHHPVWLYAEAGMGFVPAPKSNIKSGYTVRAGGGVGYGLSSRRTLTLSGGYVMQKNGFDFQKSSTVQQPGFAARSNFNTLTPDRLHFVYARLGLHHRIKRHMISVFGGGQYLYGAQGTVVVKSEDVFIGVDEKTKYAWLKLDGMNRLWWNAELNYGYQLTPRFSIQAGVKYSFTSLVATDQELKDKGYFWKGDLSSLSPSFTINYHLYGKR